MAQSLLIVKKNKMTKVEALSTSKAVKGKSSAGEKMCIVGLAATC